MSRSIMVLNHLAIILFFTWGIDAVSMLCVGYGLGMSALLMIHSRQNMVIADDILAHHRLSTFTHEQHKWPPRRLT